MAANGVSEQLEQINTPPNEEIQSLIGSVAISAYTAEKLSPILADQTGKELLIKELKENQPISGGLMLSKIIQKIKSIIEKPEVSETSSEVSETSSEVSETSSEVSAKSTKDNAVDIKNNIKDRVVKENIDLYKKRLELANSAAKDVNDAIFVIEKGIGGELKSKISGEINTKLQDINSGKISDETKNFLNTIGANTPESIASPEVQSILTAHISTRVYLENKDSILKTNPEFRTNPELGKQFDILDGSKFALGLSDRTEAKNIPKLLTDQPKSDREAITSTVNSLTKGSPDTMITRTGDRLTFQDPKDERYTYDIDMAKRPPQLSKSLGRLSISRDIVPLSREDQEKSDKKNQAEKQLKSSQDRLSESKNDFWQIRRDEYILQGENKTDGAALINLYSQYLGENRWNHTQYETLEQAYAQGGIAEKDKVSTLEQMGNLTESMRKDNAKKILDGTLIPTDREKITRMLEERKTRLDTLKRSEESLARVDKKALEYTPQNNSEKWEKDASESLSFFSELGLNNLGQQGFEDIMEAWNEKHKQPSKLYIDLSKNPKIDDLQKEKFRVAIDSFTGGSNNRDRTFVGLVNNLKGIELFRDNNWNTKEKRAEFLFGNKKQNPVLQNT